MNRLEIIEELKKMKCVPKTKAAMSTEELAEVLRFERYGRTSLSEIAGMCMMGGKKSDVMKHWTFRKNKGWMNFDHAVKKGLKQGNGRTERELDWIALYLREVLKRRPYEEVTNAPPEQEVKSAVASKINEL